MGRCEVMDVLLWETVFIRYLIHIVEGGVPDATPVICFRWGHDIYNTSPKTWFFFVVWEDLCTHPDGHFSQLLQKTYSIFVISGTRTAQPGVTLMQQNYCKKRVQIHTSNIYEIYTTNLFLARTYGQVFSQGAPSVTVMFGTQTHCCRGIGQ